MHLNFSGQAELIWRTGARIVLHPGTLWWVRGPPESLRLCRRHASSEPHECLSLFYPDPWLAHHLKSAESSVAQALAPLAVPPFARFASFSRPLTQQDRVWAHTLMAPHLCEEAQLLLNGARLTEFLVREAFRGDSETIPAQKRTERIAKERIERVKTELLRCLDAPPALDQLAQLAGCTSSHLSRTFARIEGVKLSVWLRRVRIDRAAELIASGSCNVSEAALEVGYQSFSHFSQAFCKEKGVPPSRWIEHLHMQTVSRTRT